MNGYLMIIGLFIVCGLAITAWGLRIMAEARRSQHWPSVKGEIIHAGDAAETADLLPDIRFRYALADEQFTQALTFPSGTMPTPEFNSSYLKKYPVGTQVEVYYNPEQPEECTLEPGMANGDWMVLAAGVITILIGIGMLLVEL